jgi:hypothetical protein
MEKYARTVRRQVHYLFSFGGGSIVKGVLPDEHMEGQAM